MQRENVATRALQRGMGDREGIRNCREELQGNCARGSALAPEFDFQSTSAQRQRVFKSGAVRSASRSGRMLEAHGCTSVRDRGLTMLQAERWIDRTFSWLKMNHDSSRDANIVLGIAEKAGLKQIALHAPTDQRNQMVIQTTAQGIRKRSIRARQQ